MKKLLLTFLLWASPSWATITLVQHVVNNACSGTTCVLSPAATGAGHILIIGLAAQLPNRTISTLSAGCGSWAHGASQAGSNVNGASTDAQYCLNSTAGVTSITVTLAGGSVTNVAELMEYSFTGASVAYDTSNNVLNSVNTNRVGVDLTALTGTNDLLYQVIALTSGGISPTAISGAYTSANDFGVKYGFASAVNTVGGSAPNWTFSANSQSAGSGLAIKETSSTAFIKRHNGGIF